MKIQKIELFIPKFEETAAFYKEKLNFPLLQRSHHQASFKIGQSTLVLHREEKENNYYHYAINIPPNLFQEAKLWLKERITLLLEDGKDDIHFTESKAMAMYFEDPAGNIVEFISRYETSPKVYSIHFTPEHMQEISEIGVSTNNTHELAEKLQSMGIPVRNNEPIHYEKYLNFFGEWEEGAFIILGPLGRRWLFSEKVGIKAPVIIETDRGVVDLTNI